MGIIDSLLAGLGAAGNVIDLPASSLRDMIHGSDPWDQWSTPTQSANRVYGRDILEKYGMLGENTPGLDTGDIAGFGIDLVADPINLISGGLGIWNKLRNRAASKAANLVHAKNQIAMHDARLGYSKYANEIEQANSASQAMREAGALPGELLPQAIKAYRDIHPTQATPVPGRYTGSLRESRGTPHAFDTKAVPLAYKQDMPNPYKEVNPALRTLDDTDLNDVARRINVGLDDLENFGLPDATARYAVEKQARDAIDRIRSDQPFEALGELGDPEALDQIEELVRKTAERRVRENAEKMYNPGQALGQEISEDMKFAVDDYMAGEGAREIRNLANPALSPVRDARMLLDELTGSVGPGRQASESFYVVPDKTPLSMSDVVDPQLIMEHEKALLNRKLPGRQDGPLSPSQQQTLFDMQSAGKNYYDAMYGRNKMGSHFNPPEVMPGVNNIEAILDPKMNHAFVAPGTADTYLPYVAPEMRAPPRWINPAMEEVPLPGGSVGVTASLDPVEYAKARAMSGGKQIGEVSLMPPAPGEYGAATRGFPGIVPEGAKVARVEGSLLDDTFQGQGIGQQMYIDAMNASPADWFYNSGNSDAATRALEALQKKGLAEIHWGKRGAGGPRVMRLTPEGQRIAGTQTLVNPRPKTLPSWLKNSVYAGNAAEDYARYLQ